MAEKTEQGIGINQINKGLFTDVAKEQQPKGTYTFALNAVDSSSEGDMFSISNENSNDGCASIPDSYALIGSVYMEDDATLLFLVDEDTNNSVIATLNKNCQFTELVVSDCLGFSLENQIEGTFRIKNGCERIVYFVDHSNPDRYINIDDLEIFLEEGFTINDASVSKWNCSKFNIDKVYQNACISLVEINEFGGNIPVGTVQFAVQHLDENLNGSGFTDSTNTIPITNDSYGLDYEDIDGADPDTPTSKSVEISISNIDTEYEYIQVAAIITNSGVTQTYIIERLPITGSTMNYLFKGITSTSEEVDTLTYFKNTYSSKTITQLENRLIRANVKNPDKDFSNIQRDHVNNIHPIYVVRSERALVPATGAKSDDYYFNNRSYMRDEIYAFGIYYIYDDGTKSPVFHIPGREKDPSQYSVFGDWNNLDELTDPTTSANPNVYSNAAYHSRAFAQGNWDTTQYNIVSSGEDWKTSINENETRHLGLVDGDTVERWRVYNTAIRHQNSEVSFMLYTGEMAYHEGTTTYPTTTDCDGNYIYGDLAGTPIRHHRFPDTTLEPHFDGDDLHALGIHFKNITLPAGAIGYKIVRCERDDLNKTVLDKGIAQYARSAGIDGININFQAPFVNRHYTKGTDGDEVVPDGPEAGFIDAGTRCPLTASTGRNDSLLTYHSALTKFRAPSIVPVYIKTELNFRGETSYTYGTNLNQDVDNTSVQYTYDQVFSIKRNSRTNISVDNYAYVGANSIENTVLSNKFINNYQSETLVLDLNSEAFIIDENSIDVASEADTQAWLADGAYRVDYSGYYSVKSGITDVYNNLESLVYYPASDCVKSDNALTVFSGDIFISRMDYKHTFRSVSCATTPSHRVDANDTDDFRFNDGSKTDEQTHNYTHMLSFWGESEVNSEMRHEESLRQYYPKSYQTNSELVDNFLIPSLANGNYRRNYYIYNQDFSKTNTAVSYVSLPTTWKYCSDCLNEFTNRVIYSEQSFQEEISDHYLITLVNNYKDIMSSRGDITKIYNYKNTIVIDAEESRFVLPSTSQSIQASEENIYIGTGQFFSAPVKEVVDSEVGYMGNQSQWASKVTEHGLFSVDARSGNIFLYNSQINLLSGTKYGMSNYFREELPLNIIKQYEEIRQTTVSNIDNPANPYSSIGYTSVFDSRHNRIILTKHDWELTSEGIDLVNSIPLGQRLDYTDEGWKYITLGGASLIKPSDYPQWFVNKSWTMSFSINRNAWISWHSYLPTNYIEAKIGFYSVDNKPSVYETGKFIWKHNKRFSYQTFYGIYQPHIVEFVSADNPIQTDMYNSISFITKAKQWDATNKYFVDKRLVTYDKAIVYNNYQCSGLINLLTKRDQTSFNRDQESWDQQALLDVNERTYSFNEFRDLVGDYDVPMFTKDWSNTDYQGDYYIDKIINPSSINLNKNWWEQDVFRGKHLTLRLFFSILDNVKLTTQFQLFEKGTTHR